ncbi:MAG: O-antigen ligase family protein, partial [Bacteroidota bacterium]|nr:O-antigen ligase family protein [Bacteroidota bacterium]
MLNILKNNRIQNLLLLLMLATLVFFIASFFIEISIFFGFLLLVLIYVFIISFYYPFFGILSFLLIRPLLDFSTDYNLFSFSSWSINLASLMGIMVLILALWYLFFKHKEVKGSRMLYFWILFIVVNALSLLVSFDISLGIREITRLLSIASIFLLAQIFVKTKKDLTISLKLILMSAILPALIGVWQYLYKADIIAGFDGRLVATFAHPNMLAFFTFFAFSISLFIFLYGKKDNVLSYFYFLASIIFLVIITLTYTRGSWLALLIFIFIIGAVKFRKLLLVSIIIVLLVYSFVPTLQQRVNDTFNFQNYDSSIVWRYNLYQDSYAIAKEKPILGHGSDTASTLIEYNRSYRLGSPEPHNDYMKTFMETGVIGLSSLFLLILSTTYYLYRQYKSSSLKKIKALNFFLLASFVAISLVSFGDNVLNDTALQWSMWFVIG